MSCHENLNRRDSYKNFLNSSNVYEERWLKPLLLSVEYFEQESRDFIEINRNLHTEHILPQTYNGVKSWDGVLLNWKDSFTQEDAQKYLNSLGNLTLLTGKKNIEASNCNFDKKVDIYKGNSGKSFDGKTSFEITKSIIEDYSEWTMGSIENRHLYMVEKIDRILQI